MKKLLFLLFLAPISYGAQSNLDSLWSVWDDSSQPDSSRFTAMFEISWYGYLETDPDSSFYFAQILFDQAKKKSNKNFMAAALNTQGVVSLIRGEFENALNYHTQSMKWKKEINHMPGIAASYINMGNVYYEQADYVNAIKSQTEALKIHEELGSDHQIAMSLNSIGVLYASQGDYEEGKEHFNRALEIGMKNGDKRGIATCYTNLASTFCDQDDTAQGFDYLLKAEDLYEEIGEPYSIAVSKSNLASMFLQKGELETALAYCTESIRISKEINDVYGMTETLRLMADIHFELGNYSKAIEYGSKSLSAAKEMGAISILEGSAKTLWETFNKLGRYKEALEMHELYIESRDSLESEENHRELVHQQFKYEYEKQTAQDSIKAAEEGKVKDALLENEKVKNQQQQQQKYFLFGGLALALLFGGFIFNRFRVTKNQKKIIETQKEQVDNAFDELEEKNTEIMDSINYAKRIQSAILPPSKVVKEYLQESFILYKPKDIVAGDFYWLEHRDNKVLFAAADCTGHGVPGAMVSVVCNNGLNRSVREYGLSDPGQILDKTREIVIQEFEKSEDEVKDGMDIALCSLEGNTLKYAGAHNPLWIIRNGEVLETKANKQPIGKFDKQTPYTTNTFELEKGDSIYIFSDGYVDQFGGERGKKFKSKAFRELLLSIQSKTMEEQRVLIDEAFEKWRGSLEQIDDVCVIGVRI